MSINLDWVKVGAGGPVVELPYDRGTALEFTRAHMGELREWVRQFGATVRVKYLVEQQGEVKPCRRGFRVVPQMAMGEGEADLPAVQDTPGSYGAIRLSPRAGYDEVMDFIWGQQHEGRIVTVMGMNSDKFLYVNGAQVADRGGTAETWMGVDAKALVWGRSLRGTLPGRDRGVNYYRRLYELLERDSFIPEYSYCVTRPGTGDLYRDTSTYYYLQDYLGVPARMAVSRVGDSELVEAAQR